MNIGRCLIGQALTMVVLLAGCTKSEMMSDQQEAYRFFVAGHVSGNPANWHQGFHAPFREKGHLISQDSNIAFGLLLGDMVKKGSISNFDALDADIKDLGKPIHVVAGNHDVTDRPLFDQRYGPSYYSFLEKGDLFIVLDSNLDGWNISGKQLEFLKGTLEENHQPRNVFIFVHHLLWWSRENKFSNVRINSSTGRADQINFYSELLPLFEGKAAPFYIFAGDVGAQATGSEYMYYRENEVTLIATGMGGGVRDNFITIDVDPNGQIRFDLVAINGDDRNALGNLEDYILPE